MPVKTIEREPDAPFPGENPVSAGLGHNRPPVEETVAAEFREELLRNRPDFLHRFDDMIAAADRVVIESDETLGRAGDLAKMYRAAANHIDETHQAVKAPYLAGGRAVDAQKNALRTRLDEAGRRVSASMNAFVAQRAAEQRAEQERIAAEQRAAAEVAAQVGAGEVAPIAAAEPRRPEPVRSDAGATVSTKEVWNSEVEDYLKAFKAVKTDPKVREAIDAAISRLVRAGQREIPGVKVWPTQQAIAR